MFSFVCFNMSCKYVELIFSYRNIIARDSRFHSILSKRRDELSADVTYDHNVRTFTTELSRRNKNIYGLEHEHASFFSGVAFSLFVFTVSLWFNYLDVFLNICLHVFDDL